MGFFIEIFKYIVGTTIVLFIFSLVKFYFHRKRQLDKVKIIKFMSKHNNTASTYKIHQNIFKKKPVKYVKGLLRELELENTIKHIKIGNSSSANNNGIWEYIDN